MIKPDSIIQEIIRVPESEADTYVGPRNIRRLEKDKLEGFGVMPGVIPDVCYPCPFVGREYVLMVFSLILVSWDWMMM